MTRQGWLLAKGRDSRGRLLYRWGDLIAADLKARESGRGRPRAAA